ncbi:multicopper oxidase family protein [Thermoactinomyces sp. DSM 45892]|uniref:multicopper oxidase family protein n=1 Tax=Thermoactinomyces sp. DSM 45892 TaxID=1882753 RepID=UPI00089CE591|nr:multicopper oxidase domain-containing protein [Thermoactinomyces sp. DSM 45892]SDY24538.1 Multicopper oxidase [Thermoactinomyces sp. DSM 45892]
MIITPDVILLPCTVKNGVKHFELVAEPVRREILPGVFINALGYNGCLPGPTILVYPGDCVNIRVVNRLSEGTSVHWHGLDIPNRMDGVPEIEPSPLIEPNHYFDYRFKVTNPPGTHMYHSHYDAVTQEMSGLSGGFIIVDPKSTQFDRDYFIMLHEFHLIGLEPGVVKKGIFDINPRAHDFNFFTMNGRCFPFTTPLHVKQNERVRIRLGNVGMSAHPIHLHGHQFRVRAADGNTIPKQNRLKRNTILVAPGETYDIEFKTNNPGIWPFHCHIPHHMSNNLTKPAGGMFTTVVYQEED